MFNVYDNQDLRKILYRYKWNYNLDQNSKLNPVQLEIFIRCLAEQIRIVETGDRYGSN